MSTLALSVPVECGAAPKADAVRVAKPSLTVVIPCFNEIATIGRILEKVKKLPVALQVIVVDNCSTDGTREFLHRQCRELTDQEVVSSRGTRELIKHGMRVLAGPGFRLVLHPQNLQKGASVKTGFALAETRYVVCQDADLEYEPLDLLRLLRAAEERQLVAVFGTRAGSYQHQGPLDYYHWGRRALTSLFCLLYGTQLTDVATCYKMMRTDVVRGLRLEASGFDLDFEIPAKLRLAGHEIQELAIRYVPRDVKAGKKIRWRHGVSAGWTLLRWRLARGVAPSQPELNEGLDVAHAAGQ